MIEIINDGPDIAATNYFDCDLARRGYLYLSWNAGAARILLPDVHAAEYLADMRTGRELVWISRGPHRDFSGKDMLELLFDDGSDRPFALFLDAQQSDLLPAPSDDRFAVSAWTRAGKAGEWIGRYRVAPHLPWLKP